MVSLAEQNRIIVVNRSEIANVSIIARIAARDQGRALTCTGVPPAPTLGLEPRESGLLASVRASERGWMFLPVVRQRKGTKERKKDVRGGGRGGKEGTARRKKGKEKETGREDEERREEE